MEYELAASGILGEFWWNHEFGQMQTFKGKVSLSKPPQET